MFISKLFAASSNAPSATQNIASMIIPMLLIFVFFYLFIIRPQSNRQKKLKALIDGAKKGDSIVTVGGIVGKISAIKDEYFIIETGDSTSISIRKNAISSIGNEQ